MNNKYYIVLLLSLFYSYGLSQGINNQWLMGGGDIGGPREYQGMAMNFHGTQMDTSWEIRKMLFYETNAVICDKQGSRLFYSNGVWIANTINDTMLNGTGLNPSTFTAGWESVGTGLTLVQANLIIPFPDDTNKYYLFHQTVDDEFNSHCSLYLYSSIIDRTGDAGKGAVIQKNNILLNDSLITGGLTACKHANGRDWWLIAHQYRTGAEMFFSASNLYYKFLITPSGILTSDTQSIGMSRVVAPGQCVFSPDGKYFALYEGYNIDIFDFDRCTGVFSPKANFLINDSAKAFGVAFSPNSKLLYVSSGYDVDQFNMDATDIATSKTTVLIWDRIAPKFFLAQLAPDGKIYIVSTSSSQVMHVINNPNIQGLGCNACQHCVQLPVINAWTIANHPNYFLGAEAGSVCDSLTSVRSLSVQSSELKVFPNPVVSEEVTFTYNVSPEPGVITVYNVEGKEVAQYNLPQWSSIQHLKLPKLANGMYLARLKQGSTIANVKFIKE